MQRHILWDQCKSKWHFADFKNCCIPQKRIFFNSCNGLSHLVYEQSASSWLMLVCLKTVLSIINLKTERRKHKKQTRKSPTELLSNTDSEEVTMSGVIKQRNCKDVQKWQDVSQFLKIMQLNTWVAAHVNCKHSALRPESVQCKLDLTSTTDVVCVIRSDGWHFGFPLSQWINISRACYSMPNVFPVLNLAALYHMSVRFFCSLQV